MDPTGTEKPSRVTLVCQECGRIFRVSPNAFDPRCPKCHSVDWDVR
jgi:Zn finger protein HypA/HybF involved in hydrogenase expression